MKTIQEYTSIQLCDIIITNRYLKIYKEKAIIAMEQLALKRQNGDNFDYESYIEDNLKTLPDLNIDIKNSYNLTEVLESLKEISFKKLVNIKLF
jgi:hypothetical protein